jgi:hypothetical protein
MEIELASGGIDEREEGDREMKGVMTAGSAASAPWTRSPRIKGAMTVHGGDPPTRRHTNPPAMVAGSRGALPRRIRSRGEGGGACRPSSLGGRKVAGAASSCRRELLMPAHEDDPTRWTAHATLLLCAPGEAGEEDLCGGRRSAVEGDVVGEEQGIRRRSSRRARRPPHDAAGACGGEREGRSRPRDRRRAATERGASWSRGGRSAVVSSSTPPPVLEEEGPSSPCSSVGETKQRGADVVLAQSILRCGELER